MCGIVGYVAHTVEPGLHKAYIPAQVPALPPSRLSPNNVFSWMRHACAMALHFSIPIAAKPAIFIRSR